MFSDQFNTEEENKLASLLKAAQFIGKIKAGALTTADRQDLDNWLREHPKHQQWLDDLFNEGYWAAEMENYILSAENASEAWLGIQSRLHAKERAGTTDALEAGTISSLPSIPPQTRTLYKWGWAAAIIVLLGSGVYLLTHSGQFNNSEKNIQQLTDASKVFSPANQAILTLQSGEQVQLDSSTNALLTEKGIRKGRELLSYEGVDRTAETNTLTTPRGVQYQLILADGTKVWLNAESSITYPSAFNTRSRKVKVTGEVYFEVAPNKSKPFFVTLENQEIQVLGTSFNINAYANESIIHTTLIEGAIKVNYQPALKDHSIKTANTNVAENWSVVLAPGQQAQVLRSWNEAITTPPIMINTQYNKERILAWKNGLFNFQGADIYEVMRQLERWYNIKIVYDGKLRSEEFQGKMYRNVSLGVVLEMLEKMGYKWKVNGDVYTIIN